MNTTKLYNFGDLNFLVLSNGVQYTITNYAVFRSAVDVSSLTPVPFDFIVSSSMDNAISGANDLVTSISELKVIQALVQEKIEDFD
jgi:hypothetical protein